MKKGCAICEYAGDNPCVPVGSRSQHSIDQVRVSCRTREAVRQNDDSHLAPLPGIPGPALDFSI